MAATFLAALGLVGRRCTVVGGDEETARRARALLDEGASVRVRWPESTPVLAALQEQGIEVELAPIDAESLITGSFLTILAPQDPTLAAALFAVADREARLFCAVDQPEYCTFAHVAIARAGPVRVGISTGGEAPLLARRMREAFERGFSEEFVAFAREVARVRTASAPGTRHAATAPLLEGFELSVSIKIPGDRSSRE
jgi:siroheme synthase-like protein